ncbi:MAG: translational GTPase TypA [Verrucomicrobia bacterium]|nr:translational GTPase TypA [Verrucomicrobiota bacterium]MDA1088267.1 translational GTPase TypA [Verrucomicrobiota bacterium]
MSTQQQIRNIGIIAHVDHGKTTLVDCLLRQSGVFQAHQATVERAMDSMDLEREKGITIKSKNASVQWHEYLINIVDTPGHADFGGEVERILQMVDGVLVLVDAAEGPQAQTRFVLKKAIEQHLPLVAVINKIDRDFADPDKAHDQLLELLLELNASEEQFHAPFLYGSAKDGYVVRKIGDPRDNMVPLFETVVEHIPAPVADPRAPFEMLVSNIDWDDYVGRIAIGKITQGSVATGDIIYSIRPDGTHERGVVSKLYTFRGMGTSESTTGGSGDIVGIAGFADAYIGETLCETDSQPPLPFVAIDPPTIQMELRANNGPLSGRDGKYVTARQIRERLDREMKTNISLELSDAPSGGGFIIQARGELQIAVLVETMRREGFEVLVSRPEVIYHEENGKRLEPFEDIWLELPNECLGDVMQALAARRARTEQMTHHGNNVHIEGVIPTRGLIGFENFLVNLTSGRALLSHMFRQYDRVCGAIETRTTGSLVCTTQGISTAYALDQAQNRGKLFIGPQTEVYEGMIVGENPRREDLPLNPTRTKQLTNVRASGTDKAIQLEPPVEMSLEKSIEFIGADEYVEATPKHLRLRKKILDATKRKRSAQAEPV